MRNYHMLDDMRNSDAKWCTVLLLLLIQRWTHIWTKTQVLTRPIREMLCWQSWNSPLLSHRTFCPKKQTDWKVGTAGTAGTIPIGPSLGSPLASLLSVCTF